MFLHNDLIFFLIIPPSFCRSETSIEIFFFLLMKKTPSSKMKIFFFFYGFVNDAMFLSLAGKRILLAQAGACRGC